MNKRVTVDFDEESYYLDGEYWESWDNYGEEMADAINILLNEQDEQIQELLSCNHGLAQKQIRMLDRLIQLEKENKQLKEENNELRQDNDIKFWKLKCMHYFNANSVFMSEISRAMKKGYIISEHFQKFLDGVKEHDKEVKEKNKRLFGDLDEN